MYSMKIDCYKPWRVERLGWVAPYLQCDCVWVAGGALRTMFNPAEQINDYDMFFRSEQDLIDTRNRLEDDGWVKIFECPKKELFTYRKRDMKVQCIAKRFYRNPDDLMRSFDFNICQAVYDGRHIFITREMIRSVKTKNLTINEITYPVASINRLMKYKSKGYYIPEATLVQLVTQISGRSFDGEELALYID